VPYRRLHASQKFKKYQWINVGVERASNDHRPESHKITQQTLQIVSDVLPTTDAWAARKKVIMPLKAPSMCALRRQRDEFGSPTLGIFKPGLIEKLAIKKCEPQWSQAEIEIMKQGDLFSSEPAEDLEKIPYEFSYKYRCDEEGCRGHMMKCTDWEMGQSWRKWRTDYGDNWEVQFRRRYETDMRERDTHFYVGTLHRNPGEWIIVGLFYPPKKAAGLFDD
jgi:hypothetical protein